MIKEYIIETCKEYEIENYTINDDLSIDVNGDVILDYRGLTELPLTFNIVNGIFSCEYNNLTSLKGAPKKCNEFWCSYNKLRNLDYIPIDSRVIGLYGNDLLNTLTNLPINCIKVIFNYNKLDLDNEHLFVIKALTEYHKYDKYIQSYYNTRLKIEERNDLINSILN